ncbi:glycoside hydrolase family 72 protein [Viridothelium virens]|uniref:1,3-beta-glucanosyltransferase n=1 Tax=Viridothelium virens TaxID=1048519 RepID=A0A6A6GVQ6_VIRVR|nr:glycoside hydrolase family 72 protein [Viridothelium virens]
MMLSYFTALGLLAGAALAVNPVVMKGADFVDSTTNNRVMVIGVDYQPGGQSGYDPGSGVDPLSNGTVCLRDAALMQDLGLNTIRVYNVDPDLNHDQCASIFNEVGIYMIVDVNSPLGGESIDRSNPSGSYTASYLNRTFAVVEAFKGYPNTMAFFAGNEIINDVPTSKANPPYIRAVQRDLKNYIAKHSSRSIPVGYSAADVREVLQDTWAYLQCAIDGNDKDVSRSDFFGLNSYSWCGDQATFQSAGYDALVSMFSATTIPVFFSEYGCNTPSPRVFNEVQALYGPQMTTLSGGLVYEFTQETSNFGLINVNDNGTASLLVDYDNLQSQMSKLNVTLLQSSNASQTQAQPPACSSGVVSSSQFGANFTLPSTPSGAQDLINNGLSNPQQGKVVQVSSTQVPMSVYATNGSQIEGLAIKPLQGNQANTPNQAGTSGGSASNTPAPKHSGATGLASHMPGVFLVGLFSCIIVLVL